MFSLKNDVVTSFEWPIKVEIPSASDGGRKEGWREARFTGRFHMLPQAEVEEILDAIRDPDSEREDYDLANRVFAGWGNDVEDEDGNRLEDNEENKATLLDIPYVRNAILRSYNLSMGGKKARVKN